MTSIRREMFASLTGFALILFPVKASGQPCSLSMQVSHTAAEQLSLADLDFPNFRSTNLLFTVNIIYPANAPVSAMASLHLVMDITLAQGTISFPGALDLTTKSFSVPPGGRTITNMNLATGGDIQTQTYSFSREAKTKIESALKQISGVTSVDNQLQVTSTNTGTEPNK